MLKAVIDCIAFLKYLKLPAMFRDNVPKKGKDIGLKEQEVTACSYCCTLHCAQMIHEIQRSSAQLTA